jgi:6-pyruvoyltetrahydropterin/6-carboxytetrahydropterin synthase
MERTMGKFRVTKEVKFSASHVLMGLPDDHQCSRLHGHNYVIRTTLESDQLDDTGFVFDFTLIGGVLRETFDHRHLNEVLPAKMNPTAENIAKYVYDMLMAIIFKLGQEGDVEVTKVEVLETESCIAEYTP